MARQAWQIFYKPNRCIKISALAIKELCAQVERKDAEIDRLNQAIRNLSGYSYTVTLYQRNLAGGEALTIDEHEFENVHDAVRCAADIDCDSSRQWVVVTLDY